MPRPEPLNSARLASARIGSQYQVSLTPRTPHSRAGRAEEAYTEIELDDNQQDRPLLARSTSGSLDGGYRSKGDEYDSVHGATKSKPFSLKRIDISKLPLYLGISLAGVILLAVLIAATAPGRLQKIAGIKPVSTDDTQMFISYENYTTFPLTSAQYRDECAMYTGNFMIPRPYWTPMESGDKPMDVRHPDDSADVCLTTITYQLDGTVGLFADLALLAQAAALARERNRTFFVDDTYWNRGKWTDHFEDVHLLQPGHEPGCKAPPPNELVPCPRHARHWVISSKTAKYHFSHSFMNQYENGYGKSINRLNKIYQHAEVSFLETIRPNEFNSRLIMAARSELKDLIMAESDQTLPVNYVGVHIRRGDRRPMSWRYKDGYVPADKYLAGVTSTFERLDPARSSAGSQPLFAYLASDSPRAQSEFMEAVKQGSSLEQRVKVYSLLRSKKEELRALASRKEYVQADFNEGIGLEGGRVEATRGMIIDFALFSGAWDWEDIGEVDKRVNPLGVVCTMSSNICGMAAVVQHWDKAFGDTSHMGDADDEKKGWTDVDTEGTIEPWWRAFEMF
jgi:hypothetical protein